MARLETQDHPRYREGYQYVYPVVSRRAGGVSVGVNLNPNDACNWRCVYCQVPGLVAGKGPAIDLARLKDELADMLLQILEGDFMAERVPEGARRLNDIAISGNGEATSSADFAGAVDVVGEVMADLGLLADAGAPPRSSPWLPEPLRVVLITNGSLVHKPDVQAGLRRLAELNGEVWFKLDGASDAALALINNSALGFDRQVANLRTAAALAPTFVQTAAFRRSDAPPLEHGAAPDAGAASGSEQRSAEAGDFPGGDAELNAAKSPGANGAEIMAGTLDAYVETLANLVADGVPLQGVHLYSLARPSHQPEAGALIPLKRAELDPIAERLRALGLAVTVNE